MTTIVLRTSIWPSTVWPSTVWPVGNSRQRALLHRASRYGVLSFGVRPAGVVRSFSLAVAGRLIDFPRRRRVIELYDTRSATDIDLLRGAGGDEEALRELVARHQSSLTRLASAVLGNRSDAEEAVQDTFVAAHRAADTFHGDSTVKTWLHTICYRQCLTRLRRKRVVHLYIDVDDTTYVYEPDPAGQIAIENAVAELPEENRVAFALVDVLGFSREEAAALVGVAGNTMRARVARARLLLANILTEDEGQTGDEGRP